MAGGDGGADMGCQFRRQPAPERQALGRDVGFGRAPASLAWASRRFRKARTANAWIAAASADSGPAAPTAGRRMAAISCSAMTATNAATRSSLDGK
jgi:hypothetical protein